MNKIKLAKKAGICKANAGRFLSGKSVAFPTAQNIANALGVTLDDAFKERDGRYHPIVKNV